MGPAMDEGRRDMTGLSGTQSGGAKGVVVAFSAPGGETIYAHEWETVAAVARTIAALKGFSFRQGLRDWGGHNGGLYFVPDDSLLAADAVQLGINGPDDLFGGVVPWRLATTKAITHELVDGSAARPKDWPTGFGSAVGAAVLPGYTAFSRDDALRAAERLLQLGLVRFKPPRASRGRDQHTAATVADIERLLERYPSSDLSEYGLVLETELRDIVTLSIGRTAIDGTSVSYYGVQRMTADNAGQPVYGGSDLVVVRGGWEALDRLQLSPALTLAVAQARTYDAAMLGHPGFFASRRNYDIGQGVDSSGIWRSGVLEASWRIGGSSTAELAAMEAMTRDPDVQLVHACAVKQFGNTAQMPLNAEIHFHGEDPVEGQITRYTVVTQAIRGPVRKPADRHFRSK
ncbi:DUF3182 family protein [Mesorhizobium sp. M0199]|uniref:DUF3182 family protein n=1 Tax=unclassified Mesorhizobium TaxID=325217 RepID=UPI003336A184